MDSLERLRGALGGNPAIRLLRNPHALFVLAFFKKVFYDQPVPMIESDLLEGRLAAFLDDCPLALDEIPLVHGDKARRPKILLDHWCRDEIRFLRRFADEDGRVWVETTPWTQRVFQWIETLDDEALVGTESRFDEILQRLDELVLRLDVDPASRIRRLEQKKRLLDEEIARLANGITPSPWSEVQLEERLGAINRLSRALLGDFKQVEQNFQRLVREIYERQSRPELSRGDILGYTLDAAEQLRQSPQGRSFYAFWEHLIRQGERESLPERIGEMFSLLEKRGFTVRDEVLRHLKQHLHLAGRKVIAGNRLLAEKLNKLLSEQDHRHRERVRSLLADVKDALVRLKNPPADDAFWWVEGSPEVSMIVDRPLSEPPVLRQGAPRPRRSLEALSAADLAVLTGQFSVDTMELRRRVAEAQRNSGRIALVDLLETWPPEKGLSEVLAYFEIASGALGGRMNPDKQVSLPVDSRRILVAPSVEYGNE
jgi:hypothetical protein